MENIERVVSELDFCEFYDSIAYDLEEKAEEFGLKLCVGATKACFIKSGEDYVTKLPLVGEYHRHNDEFCEFTGAGNSENGWDYCLREYEVYQLAKTQGLSEFFAEVTKAGYVKGLSGTISPVYHQTRVAETASERECRTKGGISDADQKKLSEVSSRVGYFNLPTRWLLAAIDFYGVDRVADLITFLKANNLSDFHGSNVGFMDNQAPILFDYSSFAD